MRCTNCHREQLDRDQATHGLTDEELLVIGWQKRETGWVCPFCITAPASEPVELPYEEMVENQVQSEQATVEDDVEDDVQ